MSSTSCAWEGLPFSSTRLPEKSLTSIGKEAGDEQDHNDDLEMQAKHVPCQHPAVCKLAGPRVILRPENSVFCERVDAVYELGSA